MDLIIGGTDNASFVSQTVANGTTFSPGQGFSCTWTMNNNGTTTWIANGGDGYTLNYVSGTQMGAPNATAISANVGPGRQCQHTRQLHRAHHSRFLLGGHADEQCQRCFLWAASLPVHQRRQPDPRHHDAAGQRDQGSGPDRHLHRGGQRRDHASYQWKKNGVQRSPARPPRR